MVKWHQSDLEGRQYCSIDGKKIAMPRYYRNKIYDSEMKGYLKGYNEWKREQMQLEKIRQNKVQTSRDRQQYVEAQLRKMAMPDTKNKV